MNKKFHTTVHRVIEYFVIFPNDRPIEKLRVRTDGQTQSHIVIEMRRSIVFHVVLPC